MKNQSIHGKLSWLLVLCFVALAIWAKRQDWQDRHLPLHGQEQTLEHRQVGAARGLSRRI